MEEEEEAGGEEEERDGREGQRKREREKEPVGRINDSGWLRENPGLVPYM